MSTNLLTLNCQLSKITKVIGDQCVCCNQNLFDKIAHEAKLYICFSYPNVLSTIQGLPQYYGTCLICGRGYHAPLILAPLLSKYTLSSGIWRVFCQMLLLVYTQNQTKYFTNCKNERREVLVNIRRLTYILIVRIVQNQDGHSVPGKRIISLWSG